MAAPLDGARAKVARAHKHLEEFDSRAKRFLESRFYEPLPERHRDGRLIFRVQDVREPPRDEWGPIIGDCVHNLRSALDHVAYELARPPSGGDPPPRTEFPIFWSGRDYRSRKRPSGLDKIRGIRNRAARAEIERLQPYHRRKWPENKALWTLHELSRIDKHRELLVSATSGALSGFTVTADQEFSIQAERFFPHRPLKEEAMVAWVMLVGRDGLPLNAHVNVRGQLSAGEAFSKAGPRHPAVGAGVISTLRRITNFVDTDVLPRFERFF